MKEVCSCNSDGVSGPGGDVWVIGGKLLGMSGGKAEEVDCFSCGDVLEFGGVSWDGANPQGEVCQFV